MSDFFCLYVSNMNSLLCYDDLVYAWQRASSGKKKRREVQQWMEHFDTNMQHLYTDIVWWTYQIWRTRRYIVQDPVLREIVVIPFRDRIVQHLIAWYLTPLFEKQFIYDNYANRVGKWTLFGIKRIDHHIRSISENYSRETWILKCDIQSCFMSISRSLVRSLLTHRLFATQVERSKPLVLFLIQRSLFHDYVTDWQDCTTHQQRTLLPPNKSMCSCKPYYGLPLWNLTSHLFAQIVLHELDLFVKHDLHIKGYGRYVDDFVLIHNDHDYLKSCLQRLQVFLPQKLSLHIHPQKIYLQSASTGLPFLWVYLRPRCRLAWKRTIRMLEKKLWAIEKHDHSLALWEKLRSMINAYFGLLKHHTTYQLRKKTLSVLPSFWYNELRPKKWFAMVYTKRNVVSLLYV